jgi:hypothetical protein
MSNAIYPILKEKALLLSEGASGMAEAIVRISTAQGARVSFVNLLDAGAASRASFEGNARFNPRTSQQC